jgi:hypothetical protein
LLQTAPERFVLLVVPPCRESFSAGAPRTTAETALLCTMTTASSSGKSWTTAARSATGEPRAAADSFNCEQRWQHPRRLPVICPSCALATHHTHMRLPPGHGSAAAHSCPLPQPPPTVW